MARSKSSSGRNAALFKTIDRAVDETPVFDIHTHLFDPAMGNLLLWGIDDILTFHYVLAEYFRMNPRMDPEIFHRRPKERQADAVWKSLFQDHSPLSESTRGVLTILHELGFKNPRTATLSRMRSFFRRGTVRTHLDRVFRIAGVKKVIMTNDPLSREERAEMDRPRRRDPRFLTSFRIDSILNQYPTEGRRALREMGYRVDAKLTPRTISEISRFFDDWIARLNPVYLAVSLPPDFQYPADSPCGNLLEKAVLPVCRKYDLPLALMIGVQRGVNPALRLAGDALGRADLSALRTILQRHPKNKFMVTALSKENQHELSVLGRKFSNLMIFGCWWFLNVSSIVETMTRERLELLGQSFTPQHSDARVLEHLIYKWRDFRRALKTVLKERYVKLADAGWFATEKEIRRDVADLLGGAFEKFIAGS